jgi:hypothetical protein
VLVLKLTQGRVRVLVGRRFSGPGSRVELRTPSGTVSAHEGSFAAWIESSPSSSENPAASTGVTNIGRAPINFSASGEMVTLISGQSSLAQPRRPPSQPDLFRTAMPAVSRAVQDTQVQDRLKPQSPRTVLHASGGSDANTLRVGPAVPGPTQTQSKEPPLIPLTPPAVISGAATAEIAPPAASPALVVAPAPAPVPPPTPTPVVIVPPAPPTVTLPVPTVPSLPSGNSGSGSSGRGNRGRD